MDRSGEPHALAAQVIALEASLSSVLARIAKADRRLGSAITEGFSDAIKTLERLAKEGDAAVHAAQALPIVKQLRTAVLSKK
jgi:hypothetical protein